LPLMWLRLSIALPFYLVVGVLAWNKIRSDHVSNKKPIPGITDFAYAAMVGLLGYYLASLLDLYGLQYVSAQLERLVLYAYPSIVVLLGILFFGNRFNPAILLPLALTYAGLGLMYGHDLELQADPNLAKGTALVVGSAIAFAFYLLLSKRSIKVLGSLLFTSVAMTSATLATLVNHFITSLFAGDSVVLIPDYSFELWMGILALSIFATVLPSFLVSIAIKRIGPEKTSMSGTLGPVFTTLMAVALLGEVLSWMSVAGMALVVGGIYLLSRVK
ncbi:MAG: DMT family transporter, partial [Oceanobacter sp.]